MSAIHKTTDIRQYMLAGKAVFTLVSKATGVRFTYRMKQRDGSDDAYFLSVLTGPDNTRDFTYAGMVIVDRSPSLQRAQLTYRVTRGSKLLESAPSVAGFLWFIERLNNGMGIEPHGSFHHDGRCARCSRTLTDPVSVERGLGPKCATL